MKKFLYGSRTASAVLFVVIGLAGLVGLVGLAGCGPGFPVVTAEQEAREKKRADQEKKVEFLVKETSAIKETLGKTRAVINADLAQIREEISFIRGSLEEKEFETEGMKEALDSVEDNLDLIQQRLADLERGEVNTGEETQSLGATLGSINDALSSLKNSVETLDTELSELRQSQGSIEGAIEELMDEFRRSQATIDERISRLEIQSPIEEEREAAAPDPAELYMEGYNDTMEKNYTNAMETFRRFLTRFPDHELADNAQYWVGEIYYARGDWERAILEFDKVVKKYPAGEKVPDALLKQGFSFGKLGDTQTADILFRRIVEEFPGTEPAKKATERLEENTNSPLP